MQNGDFYCDAVKKLQGFRSIALLLLSFLSLSGVSGSIASAQEKHHEEQIFSSSPPKFEEQIKERSLKKVVDELDIVTNSEWLDDSAFQFTNSVMIRTPLRFAIPKIFDFSLYPKMSSAIKKFDYDDKTKLIEVTGEASGLHMHSWIKVDQKSWSEQMHETLFTIVRGDMTGFKVRAYLWDKQGKTLAIAKGHWPEGRNHFSWLIAPVFKLASETVLGFATGNFRSYIEEEYKKLKNSK